MSEEEKAAKPDEKQSQTTPPAGQESAESKPAAKSTTAKRSTKAAANKAATAKSTAPSDDSKADAEQVSSTPNSSAPVAPNEDAPTAETKTVSESPARKGTSGGGLATLVVVLFLLLLAGLAGASWYGWTLIQADQAALAEIKRQQIGAQSDLDARLAEVRQRVASVSDALAKQDQSLTAKTSASDQRISSLSQQFAQLSDRLGRGDLAWHIAEIGSLLTRAQERLSVARDPRGALIALDLADQRLAALGRPELLPVRSAISELREALAKNRGVDRIGLALQLRQVADSVPDWPLKGEKVKSSATGAASAEPATDVQSPAVDKLPWYRRAWQSTRDWFTRQFTLTRSDEPVKASARATTDRETRIWLTAVRESLLARDTAGVGSSVMQAEQWIKAHYSVDAASVGAALKALDETRRVYADQAWPSMAKVFLVWDAAGLSDPQQIAKDGFKQPAKDAGNGGGE